MAPNLHAMGIQFSKLTSLLLLIFIITGCSYYKVVTKVNSDTGNFMTDILNEIYPEKKYPREYYPENNLIKMLLLEWNIYAIDSNSKWLLEDLEYINDSIRCISISPPGSIDSLNSFERRRSRRYKPSKEADAVKRILLFTDDLKIDDTGSTVIASSSIYKCDVYKKDNLKSAGFIMLIGLPVAIIIIPFILLAISPPLG
jgi:hypothetical protein